jgi:hypothetical protein
LFAIYSKCALDSGEQDYGGKKVCFHQLPKF